MLKRYRYRVYPTVGQEQSLARLFGCVRVVFNDTITARRRQHDAGTAFENASTLQTRLVKNAKLTARRSWLSEVSSTPLEQAVRDADRAYRNFFDSLTGQRKGRRVGAPRLKSRRDHRQAARFTRSSRFRILGGWANTGASAERGPDGTIVRPARTQGGRLRLPKIGDVTVAWSRPLPADPSSVTIVREADGRYYASFVVEVPDPEDLPGPAHRIAGIDLGLSDFAAIVHEDGTREKVANPRHLRARQRRLARAQRALARKAKGSANRDKARRKVAAEHRKVRDIRTDFLHKLALDLIRENQTVAVEGLNVVGLSRSGGKNAQGRGLRRSVADASWGTFLRLLGEKAGEHGRRVVVIDPAHTSQTCAVCGVLDGPKPLKVRVWKCGGCGAVLDRDYNAAVNIMVAAGQAPADSGPRETQNACGGDIRLALASAVTAEAGTHPAAHHLAA